MLPVVANRTSLLRNLISANNVYPFLSVYSSLAYASYWLDERESLPLIRRQVQFRASQEQRMGLQEGFRKA